MSTNAETILK